MANKQISDLQARTFDGDSIIPHDVENTDPSTMSQKPYLTGSATGHVVADFVGNGEIYTTDLNTVDKHINGAINELHAINGYSYDAYDDTSTYSVGDLCIYNNALYKCTTAITTAEAWNANHWTETSIADEIGAINTALSDLTITDITSSIGTTPTGITLVTNESAVYKQGKHVFGTLLFKATTALTENTDAKMITFSNEHKPSKVQNYFGVTSNSQYNIANSVYAYISTSSGGSSDLFVKANTGNQTIIKVQIDYMTF